MNFHPCLNQSAQMRGQCTFSRCFGLFGCLWNPWPVQCLWQFSPASQCKVKITADNGRARTDAAEELRLSIQPTHTFCTVGIWGSRHVMNAAAGFFLTYEDFGRMFDNSFSACAFSPLFRPESVHSGSASWDDCDRVFPDELIACELVSWWVPTLCLNSDIVGPLWLRWVRKDACLGVTRHLFFWQNKRSLFRATAVTRGWNGHRIKSQHTKLTLERKILPSFLPGFELATFRSWVRRSNQQLSYPGSREYCAVIVRSQSLCIGEYIFIVLHTCV